MNNNTQAIDSKILKSIRATPGASAFSAKHFLQFGNRPAVSQALLRLTKEGKLRRIRQGLYDLPQSHPIIGQTSPDPMAVVRALMDGSSAQWQVSGAYAANLLGLSEQVPAKIVILTDGTSRKVPLGKLSIDFRRASAKNLIGAGTPAGMVIQAIRYLRMEGLGAAQIDLLRRRLDVNTKKDLVKLMSKLPVWVQPIIQQITL